MKFESNPLKAKIIKPYNVEKMRYATPNEIAKKALLEAMEVAFYSIDENELLTDKQKEESRRFVSKHYSAIDKRFNLDHIVSVNYIG